MNLESILVVVLSFVAVYKIYNEFKRIRFLRRYNIKKLSHKVKVKFCKLQECNYYKLRYPVWHISKKDGTADLRVKRNFIVWHNSQLYVGHFLLMSKNPYDILKVVKELRLHNVFINPCREEKIKYSKLLKQRSEFFQNNDIQKIINHYKEKPTDFERLCAELFHKMGYTSKVTPQSNDGGYDIFIYDNNQTAVIECKCYSLHNKVGRPAIQKLVGANNLVAADKMVFITTSEFSVPAISYANTIGVILIDGQKLLELLNKYNFFEQQDVKINISEWQLEVSDMRAYIPDDIYRKYF